MYDLSTESETQVTNDFVNQTHPAISGNRIIWLNWTAGGFVDVYMHDLSTQVQTRIPFNGFSTVLTPDNANTKFFPSISGDKIAWQDSGIGGIYVYDISAEAVIQISSVSSNSLRQHPDISGDKVVWEDWRNGNGEIYMYDLTLGAETRVTNQEANQKYPAIDGNKIVWADDRHPNRASDIHMYDLSTQVEIWITENASGNSYYPRIAEDRVIWWSITPFPSAIYVHDLITETITRITPSNANIQTPGSSAISGDKIVWTDYRAGNADIYMYDFQTNIFPTAEISPVSTITLGQVGTFDGSTSSDSDGSIVSYSWDFGDGATESGVAPSHAYALPGTYSVTLTVTDDDGATDTTTVSAVVNTPPVAVITPIGSVVLATPMTFDGSGSYDLDGTIISYFWDFGDGTTGSGGIVTHTYAVEGAYQVTLAVIDTHGAGHTASISINVIKQLTSLDPAQVWIGIKNSDAVGIKFDLKAEVYKDGVLVTSGHLDSVSGGSSGFGNANLNTIPFTNFSPIDFPTGSSLSVKVSARNACVGSGKNSGTARLWFNDSAANSQFGATITPNTDDYYLLDGLVLGISAGPGPKKNIDVAAGAKCSPFKSFGTWQVTPN